MRRIKGTALLETIYSLSIISISLVIMIGIFSSIWKKPSLMQKFKSTQQAFYFLSIDDPSKKQLLPQEVMIKNLSVKEFPEIKIKSITYKKEKLIKTYSIIE